MVKLSRSAMKEMQRIDFLAKELRAYTKDRPYGLQDVSDDAFSILQQVLAPYKAYLLMAEIVVACYGSIQYHDPRTLNCNIHFLSWHENEYGEAICREIFEKLHQVKTWPSDSVDPDIAFLSFDQVREEMSLYNLGAKYDSDVDTGAGMMVSVYTSKLLFKEQFVVLERMKELVLNNVTLSSQLRRAMIHELLEVVAIRVNRRIEIKNGYQFTPLHTSVVY